MADIKIQAPIAGAGTIPTGPLKSKGPAVRVHFCEICNTTFKNVGEHRKSKGHIEQSRIKGIYCVPCEKFFFSNGGLQSHLRTKSHRKSAELQPQSSEAEGNTSSSQIPKAPSAEDIPAAKPLKIKRCKVCETTYIGKPAVHKISLAHVENSKKKDLYCHQCETAYTKRSKLKNHNDKVHNDVGPTEFRCCDCNASFQSNNLMKQHDCADVYSTTFSCKLCNRKFRTKKDLAGHLRSPQHRPLKCMAIGTCRRNFKDLSSMLMHLESGACVSKVTRASIDALVKTYDTLGLITARPSSGGFLALGMSAPSPSDSQPPALTIQIPNDDQEEGGVCLTPTSTSSTPIGVLTPMHGASSPGELEFRLLHPRTCFICNKEFFTEHSLGQHAMSPVHAIPIYHCPREILGPHGEGNRMFKTLSSLAKHVEIGACTDGKEGWQKVVEFLQDKLKEFGITGFQIPAK